MSTANRGFASMDPDARKRIASMGGKAAHAKGTAHKWNSKQAADAGRKGGLASQAGRRGEIMDASTDVGADVPGGGAI